MTTPAPTSSGSRPRRPPARLLQPRLAAFAIAVPVAAVAVRAAVAQLSIAGRPNARWVQATVFITGTGRHVVWKRSFVFAVRWARGEDRRQLASRTDHPMSVYRHPLPSAGAWVECSGRLVTASATDAAGQWRIHSQPLPWMIPRWTDEAWTRSAVEAVYALGPLAEVFSEAMHTGKVTRRIDPPAAIVPQHRIAAVTLTYDRRSGRVSGQMIGADGETACTISSSGAISLPGGRKFPEIIHYDVAARQYTMIIHDTPPNKRPGSHGLSPFDQKPVVPENLQPVVWRCALRYRVRYAYFGPTGQIVPASAELLAMPWGDRILAARLRWKVVRRGDER